MTYRFQIRQAVMLLDLLSRSQRKTFQHLKPVIIEGIGSMIYFGRRKCLPKMIR
ncbi:MAG: hypothetical protein ACLFUB_14640 [Cyclobacteriaceae bacterium]